ncbi:MAG: SBBP repeat-containing protein [Bryobacteraceae bacterium]
MRKLILIALPAMAIAAPRMEPLGNLPVHFEPGPGGFVSRGATLSAAITPHEAVLSAPGSRVLLKLAGSHGKPLEGLERQPGVSNYYLGNNPAKWSTGVPHFARVISRDVYPGIDAIYYASGRQVEYDFSIAPGADPGAIRLAFEGATKIRLHHGDLVLSTAAGEFRQHKPRVYQEIAGRRVEIAAEYRLEGVTATFALAAYDPSRPLVIDPILTYGTFLGGASSDTAVSIGTDSSGAIYIGGVTNSTDFPLQNPADPVSGADAFITKLTADGKTLVYSTYFGGSGVESAAGIAVHASGNVYLAGTTYSTDLPVANAFRATPSTLPDAFAVRLGLAGNIVFSTYLGGSADDHAGAIAIDSSGAPYIAGGTSSTDFPGGGSDGANTDTFVTKLDATGTLAFTFMYSVGSSTDARSIAVDSTGIYVTGIVESFAFPIILTRGAPQAVPGGTAGFDAYVAKLTPDGTAVIYSTYLGGSRGDEPYGIAVDSANNAYVTGWTESEDFPVRNAIYPTKMSSPALFNTRDAFVTKISADGTALVYSTYLGGANEETALAIAVDSQGRATIAGKTNSPDFPTYGASQPEFLGSQPAFVTRLRADGAAIDYSTFLLGGEIAEARAVRIDGASTWIAGRVGCCSSPAFPANSTFDASYNSGNDAFAVKLDDAPAPVTVTFVTSPAGGRLRVDGRFVTTPYSAAWQPGISHAVDANVAQTGALAGLGFAAWSQGGGAAQIIATPGSPQTYTATYSSGVCGFALSPAALVSGFEGGTFTVNVTTGSSCTWNAATLAPWITIVPGNHTGSGAFAIGIAPNLLSLRNGSFTVGGVTVAVTQEGGAFTTNLAAPAVTQPASGAAFRDQGGLTFAWSALAGAASYDIRVGSGTAGAPLQSTVFRGSLLDSASTQLRIDGLTGSLVFFLRACNAAGCGPVAQVPFSSTFSNTFGPLTITAPLDGETLTASTNEFKWTAVTGATRYRVKLRPVGQISPEMQIFTPTLSTIYSLQGLGDYALEVAPCTDFVCGTPAIRSFRTNLPPVPVVAPSITSGAALTGSSFRFNWTAVSGADIYRIQVVQPSAGPGGGALTVASTQTATTQVTLTVPVGTASAFVAACNGRGCGPYSSPFTINPAGPSSGAPILGQPISVVNVAGPGVLFTWNRVPGDNGSNTLYRLYAQDLSRNGVALDVQTRGNFYGALFAAEGRRYDAVVVSNPGASQVVGPAVGFIVQGTSSPSPTPVIPTLESTVKEGNVSIGWTPVEGAAFYEYAVFRVGDSAPLSSGLTPGLQVSAPLSAQGSSVRYSAIMRACPQANAGTCTLQSDSGWGPWSNAPGGPGVTNFTVVP